MEDLCSPMQSSTSSLSDAMACTDIRATMSESSTKEVTYSQHSEKDDKKDNIK